MATITQRWRAAIIRRLQPRRPQTLPITLRTRTIYVRPTRFGLFLAATLAAMLLGGLNYNNNLGILLALATSSIYLSSAAFAHFTLSAITVHSVAATPAHAGQPLHLVVTASVTGKRARHGVCIALDHSQTHWTVLPHQRTSVTLTVATQQRGWYPLAPLLLSTLYPFGLFCASAWIWPISSIMIYPPLERESVPLPTPHLPATPTPLPDPDQSDQLRFYRPGDAVHAIAWKASARRRRLLIRASATPRAGKVMLAWQQLAQLPIEQRISRLARWVIMAEHSHVAYSLHLPSWPVLGPDRGPDHCHRCLSALALLPHEHSNTITPQSR